MTKGAKNGQQQGQSVFDADLGFVDKNGTTQAGALTLAAFKRIRAAVPDVVVVQRTLHAPGVTA